MHPFRARAISPLLLVAAVLAGACSAKSSDGTRTDGKSIAAVSCTSAVPWATGTSYASGTLVTYDGADYQCLQAHTSEATWTPDAVASLWTPVTCTAGTSTGGSTTGGSTTGGSTTGGSTTGGAPTGTASASLIFSAYKDTSINMNWNTNVITTSVSGAPTPLATDLTQAGGKTVTLAFATGECGAENWGGVAGAAMATANVGPLRTAGVKYILSTGGAAGSFTCATDAGMATFLDRWASPDLIGVDFDIEAGQSASVIGDLVARIKTAHGTYPGLRFSLTLATLATSAPGATKAASQGAAAPDGFNVYGDETLAAVTSVLGFASAATWPSYLTVNLMTMDYGAAGAGVCVVSGGACDMGQSALQAAYNLHDRFGVPYTNIELTPMIGGNDASDERFTTADVDTVTAFAIASDLAGVHYWSYDRDVDCTQTYASPTCNSIGGVGARGYLKRFLADGLR